jgi:hypothetical protein
MRIIILLVTLIFLCQNTHAQKKFLRVSAEYEGGWYHIALNLNTGQFEQNGELGTVFNIVEVHQGWALWDSGTQGKLHLTELEALPIPEYVDKNVLGMINRKYKDETGRVYEIEIVYDTFEEIWSASIISGRKGVFIFSPYDAYRDEPK